MIPFVLGINYYLDHEKEKAKELNGHETLKEAIANVNSDPAMANNNQFTRFVEAFNMAYSSSSKSNQERYNSLTDSASFLQGAYSATNNPKLYKLSGYLDEFAKENFVSLYKKIDFSYYCQDPTCADSTQPREISDITKEIEESDFPDYVKKSTSRDIINVGYISDKEKTVKALSYLFIADTIESYSNFSPSKENLKIASDLKKFVEKTYPEEFRKSK